MWDILFATWHLFFISNPKSRSFRGRIFCHILKPGMFLWMCQRITLSINCLYLFPDSWSGSCCSFIFRSQVQILWADSGETLPRVIAYKYNFFFILELRDDEPSPGWLFPVEVVFTCLLMYCVYLAFSMLCSLGHRHWYLQLQTHSSEFQHTGENSPSVRLPVYGVWKWAEVPLGVRGKC